MNRPNEIEKTNRRQARGGQQIRSADMMRASFDELKQEIKKIRGGLTGEISDLPNPLADRPLN
jgi:hypothetical protein